MVIVNSRSHQVRIRVFVEKMRLDVVWKLISLSSILSHLCWILSDSLNSTWERQIFLRRQEQFYSVWIPVWFSWLIHLLCFPSTRPVDVGRLNIALPPFCRALSGRGASSAHSAKSSGIILSPSLTETSRLGERNLNIFNKAASCSVRVMLRGRRFKVTYRYCFISAAATGAASEHSNVLQSGTLVFDRATLFKMNQSRCD